MIKKKTIFLDLKQNIVFLDEFYNDKNPYFQINNIPSVFSSGKNTFYLKINKEFFQPGSVLRIEFLDNKNQPIYLETPVLENENISKDLSENLGQPITSYIYEDTNSGEGEIVFLAILSHYLENNQKRSIPRQFQNLYNYRLRIKVKIDNSLPNDNEIRFYTIPKLEVKEYIFPYYKQVKESELKSIVSNTNQRVLFFVRKNSFIQTIQDFSKIEENLGIPSPNSVLMTDKEPFESKLNFRDRYTGGGLSDIQGALSIRKTLYPLNERLYYLYFENFQLKPEYLGAEIIIQNLQVDTTKYQSNILNEYPLTGFIYKAKIISIVNQSLAEVNVDFEVPYYQNEVPKNKNKTFKYDSFISNNFEIKYNDIPEIQKTERFISYAKISLDDLETYSGDVQKIKIYFKTDGTNDEYKLLGEQNIENIDIFRIDKGLELDDKKNINYKSDSIFNLKPGVFQSLAFFNQYWTIENLNLDNTSTTPTAVIIDYNNNQLFNCIIINSNINSLAQSRIFKILKYKGYQNQGIPVKKGNIYYLEFNLLLSSQGSYNQSAEVDISLLGSGVKYTTNNPYNAKLNNIENYVGKIIGRVKLEKSEKLVPHNGITRRSFVFIADNDGEIFPQIIIKSGVIAISDVAILTAKDYGFNPKYFETFLPIRLEKRKTNVSFKVEFYTVNGKKASVTSVSKPVYFVGENAYIESDDNIIIGSLTVGNAIDTGIEIKGDIGSSIKNIGYHGWNLAKKGLTSGFLIWSGSVNPSNAKTFKVDDYTLRYQGNNFFTNDEYYTILTGSATNALFTVNGSIRGYVSGVGTGVITLNKKPQDLQLFTPLILSGSFINYNDNNYSGVLNINNLQGTVIFPAGYSGSITTYSNDCNTRFSRTLSNSIFYQNIELVAAKDYYTEFQSLINFNLVSNPTVNLADRANIHNTITNNTDVVETFFYNNHQITPSFFTSLSNALYGRLECNFTAYYFNISYSFLPTNNTIKQAICIRPPNDLNVTVRENYLDDFNLEITGNYDNFYSFPILNVINTFTTHNSSNLSYLQTFYLNKSNANSMKKIKGYFRRLMAIFHVTVQPNDLIIRIRGYNNKPFGVFNNGDPHDNQQGFIQVAILNSSHSRIYAGDYITHQAGPDFNSSFNYTQNNPYNRAFYSNLPSTDAFLVVLNIADFIGEIESSAELRNPFPIFAIERSTTNDISQALRDPITNTDISNLVIKVRDPDYYNDISSTLNVYFVSPNLRPRKFIFYCNKYKYYLTNIFNSISTNPSFIGYRRFHFTKNNANLNAINNTVPNSSELIEFSGSLSVNTSQSYNLISNYLYSLTVNTSNTNQSVNIATGSIFLNFNNLTSNHIIFNNVNFNGILTYPVNKINHFNQNVSFSPQSQINIVFNNTQFSAYFPSTTLNNFLLNTQFLNVEFKGTLTGNNLDIYYLPFSSYYSELYGDVGIELAAKNEKYGVSYFRFRTNPEPNENNLEIRGAFYATDGGIENKFFVGQTSQIKIESNAVVNTNQFILNSFYTGSVISSNNFDYLNPVGKGWAILGDGKAYFNEIFIGNENYFLSFVSGSGFTLTTNNIILSTPTFLLDTTERATDQIATSTFPKMYFYSGSKSPTNVYHNAVLLIGELGKTPGNPVTATYGIRLIKNNNILFEVSESNAKISAFNFDSDNLYVNRSSFDFYIRTLNGSIEFLSPSNNSFIKLGGKINPNTSQDGLIIGNNLTNPYFQVFTDGNFKLETTNSKIFINQNTQRIEIEGATLSNVNITTPVVNVDLTPAYLRVSKLARFFSGYRIKLNSFAFKGPGNLSFNLSMNVPSMDSNTISNNEYSPVINYTSPSFNENESCLFIANIDFDFNSNTLTFERIDNLSSQARALFDNTLIEYYRTEYNDNTVTTNNIYLSASKLFPGYSKINPWDALALFALGISGSNTNIERNTGSLIVGCSINISNSINDEKTVDKARLWKRIADYYGLTVDWWTKVNVKNQSNNFEYNRRYERIPYIFAFIVGIPGSGVEIIGQALDFTSVVFTTSPSISLNTSRAIHYLTDANNSTNFAELSFNYNDLLKKSRKLNTKNDPVPYHGIFPNNLLNVKQRGIYIDNNQSYLLSAGSSVQKWFVPNDINTLRKSIIHFNSFLFTYKETENPTIELTNLGQFNFYHHSTPNTPVYLLNPLVNKLSGTGNFEFTGGTIEYSNTPIILRNNTYISCPNPIPNGFNFPIATLNVNVTGSANHSQVTVSLQFKNGHANAPNVSQNVFFKFWISSTTNPFTYVNLSGRVISLSTGLATYDYKNDTQNLTTISTATNLRIFEGITTNSGEFTLLFSSSISTSSLSTVRLNVVCNSVYQFFNITV